MEAKRVILMAWGESKSKIVRDSIEGTVTNLIHASFLQEHENATFVDRRASCRERV